MADTKTKSRLGRGLSSLISISAPAENHASEKPSARAGVAVAAANEGGATGASPLGEIGVGEIVPNPHQPRRMINHAAIAELAASLKSTGVIQPIVVRRVAQGYELIAGERRWRAAQHAGMKTIPAVVREVDRFAQAQMALVENIQREDLNAMDRAAAYKALIEQLGLTQAELAQRLGEDRSTIANHLRLLDLPEPVRELVKQGKLQLGHAKLLAGISNKSEQERLAQLVVTQDLSVRNLERAIDGLAAGPAPSRKSTTSAYLSELEKTLSRQVGMRVVVKESRKKGKGRLVIHYSTLDEFDQLMSTLGVKPEA